MNVKLLLTSSLVAVLATATLVAQGQGRGRGQAQDPGAQPRPPVDREQFNPNKVTDPWDPIMGATFIKASAVKDEVRPEELVLGIVLGGQARAYPINQLTGPEREIINDQLGGRAIAATW